MTRRTVIRLAAAALGLALLCVGWLVLAPRELGGVTSYALIDGSSMEPVLERGDLVLIQPKATYAIGDVVAYRSSELRRVVLHRIVGRDGERYVFKGDANGFQDAEHPGTADLVGATWITIPGAGTVLAWLHSPIHAGLVVGGLAALLLFVGGGSSGAGRRLGRRSATGGFAGMSPTVADATARVLTGTAAVLGVLAIVIGLAAFSRSSARSTTVADGFRQHGTFSYKAEVPPDSVYPTGSVVTGDPVFFKLVDRLEVGFRYRLSGPDASNLRGTAGLVARLGDASGWQRDLVLQAPTTFDGNTVALAGTVDLSAVRDQVAQFERLTGVDSSTYRLTLVPKIVVEGSVSGQRITSTFGPTLGFAFDDLRFAPELSASGSAASFARTESGSLTRLVPASLSLGGHGISVAHARVGALGLGIAALIAAGFAAVFRVSTRQRGEAARITARLGARVVTLAGPFEPGDRRPLDVDSIETLVRLADHYARPLLHAEHDGVHTYVVEVGRSLYRYRVVTGNDTGAAWAPGAAGADATAT